MGATSSNVQDFELCVPKTDEIIKLGSNITIPCHLSPKISGVDLEIRWYKETDCVCIYKNRQLTEGINYKNRVILLTEELNRGIVSLKLQNFSLSDVGDYLCQVTSGGITKEITVKVTKNVLKTVLLATGATVLAAGSLLVPGPTGTFGLLVAAATIVRLADEFGEADITFKSINRKWSGQERLNMATSSSWTEARRERRNSISGIPPTMS